MRNLTNARYQNNELPGSLHLLYMHYLELPTPISISSEIKGRVILHFNIYASAIRAILCRVFPKSCGRDTRNPGLPLTACSNACINIGTTRRRFLSRALSFVLFVERFQRRKQVKTRKPIVYNLCINSVLPTAVRSARAYTYSRWNTAYRKLIGNSLGRN